MGAAKEVADQDVARTPGILRRIVAGEREARRLRLGQQRRDAPPPKRRLQHEKAARRIEAARPLSSSVEFADDRAHQEPALTIVQGLIERIGCIGELAERGRIGGE